MPRSLFIRGTCWAASVCRNTGCLGWSLCRQKHLLRSVPLFLEACSSDFQHCTSRLHPAAGPFHLPLVALITHFVCALMWWRRKTAPVHVAILLTTEYRRAFTSIHFSMTATR